ncbi:flavodoxin family protein [Aeromicrobium wangtongii]|uniref:flavodoxin family protein n=1 Tax=Aeromicrobium wangtongii TaxID=2969247 RepID=UPI002016EF71|nr:NAD(P)H-dependent oxidoreductase [Aeromicrobium wangtongii]MCL3818966.1 NAD(P)H-dependent oxidoreductase [Aeromicrobium wangtongii]
MGLRVGVVLGSDHGYSGTTGRLVTELLDRLRADTAVEVDTVLTTDLDLGSSCPACLRCMTDGEQACPNFDRAAAARRVMDGADLVIFATPVHSFQVSASMKRFIDHFAYLIHRPAYIGRPAVLISSAAGGGHDAALEYLRSAVRRWGFHTVGQLGANGPGLARPGYRAKVDAALDDLAAEALAAPTEPEPKPTTADLIGFRVAKILVDGGRDEGPVDAQYWDERGWFDAQWWTDQKPPFVANRIATLVEKKIRKGISEGSADPYRG